MSIVGSVMVPHPPLIMREIGKGEEEKISATIHAYNQTAKFISKLNPDTIIVTSPHAMMFADYFHISPGVSVRGDMRKFRAKEVSFTKVYDAPLVNKICDICDHEDFPAGTLGQEDPSLDHGVMVPLYFIDKFLSDYKLIRIGLSGLPLSQHYRFGQIINQAVEEMDRTVVFVASGDLSHKMLAEGPYGFAPEGPEYDDRIMKVMGAANFGELFEFSETFLDHAAECGHRSFVIMAGALDRTKVKAKRLSHEATFGVGYGVCTYQPKGKDEKRAFLDNYLNSRKEIVMKERKNEDAWVSLARLSLETYVTQNKRLDLEDIDFIDEDEYTLKQLLEDRAGAFVSLHMDGNLRGCIGTFLPTTGCVAEEILQNAISSGTSDPRFSPVREDELERIEYSVDVLSNPVRVYDLGELDPKKYGVIVSCGRKRGLLLPDLDGVDTVDTQLSIAMQKGGIRTDEDITIEKFEVIRHKGETE